MMYNPILIGIHSSPKERQLQKSCVSFETECNYMIIVNGCLWGQHFEVGPVYSSSV